MDFLIPVVMVPSILFLVVIAPIWLILHYSQQKRLQRNLTDEERSQLDLLSTRAAHMDERIDTLEALLDTESPNWRKQRGSP